VLCTTGSYTCSRAHMYEVLVHTVHSYRTAIVQVYTVCVLSIPPSVLLHTVERGGARSVSSVLSAVCGHCSATLFCDAVHRMQTYGTVYLYIVRGTRYVVLHSTKHCVRRCAASHGQRPLCFFFSLLPFPFLLKSRRRRVSNNSPLPLRNNNQQP